MASRRTAAKKARRYGSAAGRAKAAAAVAGPGGGGGTMFHNIPSETNYYNPEEGKVTLRILPYVVTDKKHPDGPQAPVDDIWYKRPFKRFRQIGCDKKPFISPKSVGKPCPVMEYYQAAKADPSVSDAEANKAKPQDCVAYNVQTIDKKGDASDPMFWWFSYHNFEKQLKKELLDPDNEDFAAFMDLEGGFDIRVRWSKETFQGNDFLVADNIQFIDRDDIDEDILEKVVNLDEVLVIKSYSELNNIFLEIDDDEQVDGDGTGGTTGGNSKPGKTTSSNSQAESGSSKEKQKDPDESKKQEKEPEGDEITEEEIQEMKRGDILRLIKDEGLGVDPAKHKRISGLRDAVCEELFPEDPEGGSAADADGEAEDVPGNAKGKCPQGGAFGAACDSFDECEACEHWEKCFDEQERLAA